MRIGELKDRFGNSLIDLVNQERYGGNYHNSVTEFVNNADAYARFDGERVLFDEDWMPSGGGGSASGGAEEQPHDPTDHDPAEGGGHGGSDADHLTGEAAFRQDIDDWYDQLRKNYGKQKNKEDNNKILLYGALALAVISLIKE